MELHQEQDDAEEINIDDIIVKIREFGKSQIIFVSMYCLLMIPPTYQTLIMAFVGHNPPWRCSVIGKQLGECTSNHTFNSGEFFYNKRCDMNRTSWEYTKPKHYSIVTEFDLICKQRELSILANSVLYLGWAIGAVVLGWIADKYGRKRVLYSCYITVLCLSFCAGFVPNIWSFTILRTMIGFCLGGITLTLFILCAELVGPKRRALSAQLVWFAFTVSLCLVGLQAHLIPDWRLLLKVTTAPYLILLIFAKFTPESVRWLHVNGRSDEAEDILKKVAKRNKKTYPNVKLTPISKEQSKGSFKDLFSSKGIAIMTIIQCFIWYVNGAVYYGISLASDDLGGDMYRDFILTSLVEIPGNILVVYLSNKYGRKKSVTGSMFVAGLSLVLVAVIPGRTHNPAYNWSRVGLGMIGKLFITISFNSLYILAAEFYPTVIRSQAMALFSVTSRIGASTSPWIAQELRVIYFTVPFYFMAAICLLAACLCFKLTETKGKPTAEVLATNPQEARYSPCIEDDSASFDDKDILLAEPNV